MLDKKIDGKKIGEAIGEKLFLQLQEKNLIGKISLGILCIGQDAVSMSYRNGKEKFGEKFGFIVNTERFENVENAVFVKEKLLEMQSKNDAVILQLPLPEFLKDDTDDILSILEKSKDVDDLNNGDFVAPIVLALQNVIKYIEDSGEDISKKTFAIVGLGQVVGMPIKNYLEKNNYNFIIINKDNHDKIKECDIVISGVGIPNLITPDLIKENSILIDYGCSYVENKLYGDFDKSCYEKAAYYTPVPGCMGPLVVANLFSNVLKTYSS